MSDVMNGSITPIIDKVVEKEANKRKNPQNPIELQLNRV